MATAGTKPRHRSCMDQLSSIAINWSRVESVLRRALHRWAQRGRSPFSACSSALMKFSICLRLRKVAQMVPVRPPSWKTKSTTGSPSRRCPGLALQPARRKGCGHLRMGPSPADPRPAAGKADMDAIEASRDRCATMSSSRGSLPSDNEDALPWTARQPKSAQPAADDHDGAWQSNARAPSILDERHSADTRQSWARSPGTVESELA